MMNNIMRNNYRLREFYLILNNYKINAIILNNNIITSNNKNKILLIDMKIRKHNQILNLNQFIE